MSVDARIYSYRYWQGWVLQCRIWGAGRFSGKHWLSFTRLMVLLRSFMQDTTVLLWPVDVNRKRVINTHRQLWIEEFISILDITITIILNNQPIQFSNFNELCQFTCSHLLKDLNEGFDHLNELCQFTCAHLSKPFNNIEVMEQFALTEPNTCYSRQCKVSYAANNPVAKINKTPANLCNNLQRRPV